MTTSHLRALVALAALALAGCHARWNPLGSAPPYRSAMRQIAKDATFGKLERGQLSPEGAGYAQAFKYELPAKGSVLFTAKPAGAVSLTIELFSDGTEPVATTKDSGDKKLNAQELDAGTYYAVVKASWKDEVKASFTLLAIYKPADPEGANGPYKAQGGARELSPDKGVAEDIVDYSAMRRTNFWKIPIQGNGDLAIRFIRESADAKIKAEFIPPSAAPEPIDPTVGIKKADLQPGDYFVKVYAEDAGDAGKYQLQTTFKAGDTCKNGGPFCAIEGAEELKLPNDSKTSDVDFSKSKQFHWYKLTVKEKGKLTVIFKILQPPRGAKVASYFVRNAEDQDGEKLVSQSSTKELEPGEYWIKVMAPDQGDFAKYALQTMWAPNASVTGDVVEKGQGCVLTVNVGLNQGVRTGASASILVAEKPIDSGVVDQAFANLSKVRVLTPGCKIPAAGAKVQIAVGQ